MTPMTTPGAPLLQNAAAFRDKEDALPLTPRRNVWNFVNYDRKGAAAEITCETQARFFGGRTPFSLRFRVTFRDAQIAPPCASILSPAGKLRSALQLAAGIGGAANRGGAENGVPRIRHMCRTGTRDTRVSQFG